MKIFTAFFLLINFATISFAQGSGQPYHPMTANGAIGIGTLGHILYWENPDSVIFNEVYFSQDSSLVSSLDTSARIFNGSPSAAVDSVLLDAAGNLTDYKNYYWTVVEHYSQTEVTGNIWYFTSRINPSYQPVLIDDFENGTSNWNIETSSGCGWDTSGAQNYLLPPEAQGKVLAANADACGDGGGGSISSAVFEFNNPVPNMLVELNWDNDWRVLNSSDQAYVDVSTDNSNWTTAWSAEGFSIRNSHEAVDLIQQLLGQSHFWIKFRSVQPGWDWWWVIDNVTLILYGPLTPSLPPNFLKAAASDSGQYSKLTWDPGSSPDQIIGYKIERKNGLPSDTSQYTIIAQTNSSTFNYNDYNIEQNHNYTYRIQTISGPGSGSNWGNEATSYIPLITPVELTTFSAVIDNGKVILNWKTSTETNNKGFEIERQVVSRQSSVGNWEKIVFVNGNGTTTEQHNYSYTDNSNLSGTYKYRLKQIDYDGSYNYSKEIEITISNPKEFSLEQNYPNPFNPTTNIRFRIAEFGFVTLKVYDVLGREVATLINKEMKPGNYKVKFDGSKYPSGIYFYKLISGQSNSVKKMILIK